MKAIVVGSGFGGLASALRLRAQGFEVEVFESRDQLGGRAGVFQNQGFTFDAGPTVITAPYLLEELFSLFGKSMKDFVQLLPVDPFYRIEFHDGSRMDYVGDMTRLLEEIRKINPADEEGYLKLAAHAERIFDIGYTQLADHPFDNVAEMLRVIPDMLKLENYRSVYSLVSKYIKDPRLRQAFSFQPLLVGGNPFDTTSIYLLIHWLERKWGVFFPRGGTSALVKALVQLGEEQGIVFRTEMPVTQIATESISNQGTKPKVCGVWSKNEFFPADLVVCNADPHQVYRHMVPQKDRRKHTDFSLKMRKPSMSLFVAYFGTKKTYPDLAHHTILLGPRYEELLKDIFHRRVLAKDFSLYLHAPTRTDASLAPEGCEAFYVLSPVPNNLSGIDWKEKGPEYFKMIMDNLEERYLPGLRENLVCSHYVTPDYFEHDLGSFAGSGFGLEPIFRQSAYFRFHNKSEDIQGLYFVGASTHPGAGVPGVLCSAKVLEKVLFEKPLRRKMDSISTVNMNSASPDVWFEGP